MAVTARFVADFSSFQDAVSKAEVSLRSFETGAGKVEKSLTAMSNSLSGTKLIQDATLMTAAVEKVGGVSTLTQKELARLGPTANEAVEKLKRLGQEVPPGLQKIADASKPAASAITDITGGLGKLAAGLGIGFSVGAVVSFGKAIFDSADSLTKLSDKTGISIAGLQRLQAAGDDAGNSIDEMSSAVSQMQNRLVSGDKSAVAALGKLGLSFEDIQNLNPENQFIAISDAIRKVQSPSEQTAIAIDLFGKTGAAVLPTLKRGFDDLKNATIGMSEATVRRLDEVGDKLTEYGRIGKGVGATLIVSLLDAARAGFNPLRQAQNDSIDDMVRMRQEAERMGNAIKEAPKAAAAVYRPIIADGPIANRFIAESDALFRKNEQSAQRAAESTKRVAEEQKRLRDSFDEVTVAANLGIFALNKFGAVELPNVQSSLQGVNREMDELATRALPNLSINLNKVGQDASGSMGLFRREASQSKDTLGELSQAFSMVGQIAGGSLGGIVRDVGSVVGSINLAKTAISQMESGVKGLDAVVAGLGIAGAFMSIGTTITGVLDRLLPGFEAWDRIINKVRDSIDEAFRRADEMGAYQDRWGRWQIPTPPGGAATGGIVGDSRVLAFARGGVVPDYLARGGMARGSDTVPAMLTPGELVLNAGQQKAVGRLLSMGGAGGGTMVNISIGQVGMPEDEATFGRKVSEAAIAAMKGRGIRFSRAS